MEKSGPKILITGGAGYLGSTLVPLLLAEGHRVRILDRLDHGGDPLLGIWSHPNFEFVGGDIRDSRVVQAAVSGVDAVVHLAAVVGDPACAREPDVTRAINLEASFALIEACQQVGVGRFVFASTCSNYGVAGNEFIDENGSFNPYTPYAKAKVAAELGLKPLSDKNYSVTIMRSATAFGYSPRIRWDLVLNNLVAHAVTTGKIYMKSDGTPWRAIVHIEDISRAFTAVAEAKREIVHDNAFNIGQTKENYRVSEIAEIVAKTVPNCHIEYAPGAGPAPRCYRVNCDKLPRLVPAYQPQWSAAAAAKQVYESIKKFGLTLEDFEGTRYARLPHMKKLIAEGVVDEKFNYISKSTKAA